MELFYYFVYIVMVMYGRQTVVFSQVPASGNAIDLAQMNKDLMSAKCPIEPCQSACQQKNQTTGCYECSKACGSGNIIGNTLIGNIAGPGLNEGSLIGLSNCNSNWMACPESCEKNFYPMRGCIECRCVTENPQFIEKTRSPSPDTAKSTHTSEPTGYSLTVETSPVTIKTSYSDFPTTTLTMLTSTKRNYNGLDHIQPSQITKPPHWDDAYISLNLLHSKTENESNKNAYFPENMNHTSNEDMMTMYVLGTLLFISLLVVVVLLVVWRKSVSILARHKTELYFVHKAYKQDSNARISIHNIIDPVYEHISPESEIVPDVPIRTSPKTPVSPIVPFTQSSSLSSDAGKQLDDMRHDYLELI